ncbi:MAG: cold shock domain-containing protein [Lachnospiraceae bacterium]|nr:cold shock domain-containing protein [Lachnospiraceae bacterium]
MYGRVTKYFPDRGFGFILGKDNNSYFVHYSNLNNEYLERGYYVSFRPYQNDRSDYNAKDVIVIESAECYDRKVKSKKKRKDRSKSCNADRIHGDNKAFERFVKKFMLEKKAMSSI